MSKVSTNDKIEMFDGLTVWGESYAAQIRDSGLVIAVGPAGDREEENYLDFEETRELRDLLNIATARGYL